MLRHLINRGGQIKLGTIQRSESDSPFIDTYATKLEDEFGFQPKFDLEVCLGDVIRHDALIE